MRRLTVLVCAVALASCGSDPADPPGNDGGNAAAMENSASAQPPRKRSSYCFFKDAETSNWSASRDAQGNVVVKGRAFRSDPRYKAELTPPVVEGSTAFVSPTISQNGGYASPDNWWDVSATIPDSAQVVMVKVECGAKTLAELGLEPAR